MAKIKTKSELKKKDKINPDLIKSDKVLGTVIIENVKGRTLVDVNGVGYIIPSAGHHRGQELFIDPVSANRVPSLFAGIEIVLSDRSFGEIIQFIKDTF